MENNKSIITTLLLGIFMIVMMFVITSILTGGGNSLGNLFKYLIPCFALYGFAKPKHAIYLLFIISPFLDQIKRFMIFDFRLTEFDLALILATAPILMAAVFLRTSVDCLFQPSRENRKTLMAMALVGTLVFMFVLANSGGAKYSGIRGLGHGVNAGIYMLMIPILPRYFTHRSEYAKLLFLCTLIYLIPALWCIKQGIWGLADFEDKYVRYGLTGEIRQLNEKVFRNPGTMAGANPMACAASIFIALYIMPVVMRTGKLKLVSVIYPHRLILFGVFGTCLYFTYCRTPWVAIIAIAVIFVCLHSKVLFHACAFMGMASLTALYFSAQWIFDQRILNKWQAYLMREFGGNAGVEQTLVLGTLNGRLESMANLVNGKDGVLQPFGMKVAKIFGDTANHELVQHDIVTEYIVKFGYIPCALGLLFLIYFGIKFVNLNSRIAPSPERTSARVYLALFLGIQIMGFSHGAILQTYPLNMFIAFFLASAIFHYRLAIKNAAVATEVAVSAMQPASTRAHFPRSRPIGGPSVAQHLS